MKNHDTEDFKALMMSGKKAWIPFPTNSGDYKIPKSGNFPEIYTTVTVAPDPVF